MVDLFGQSTGLGSGDLLLVIGPESGELLLVIGPASGELLLVIGPEPIQHGRFI